MKTGVVLQYSKNLKEDFLWCMENGIPTCQLSVPPENKKAEHAEHINNMREKTGIEITALVGTWSGPNEWNFTHGPQTLGIVPIAYRSFRMKELIESAKLAKKLNVASVCTHIGFIPENPSDPLYSDCVSAIKWLAEIYNSLEINLNFETGQETPTTLMRILQDLNMENVGLNFDPANLMMYGKANPIDAIEIVGEYVKGVHIKDGEYPTNGYELGLEKPIGSGGVDFTALIGKLKKIGYKGALTIEREISGEQQRKDVLLANEIIKKLIEN